MHKTTFIFNNGTHTGRLYFQNTVMGNRLSRDSWLKASDEVMEVLPEIFKLVDDLLIGG